MWPWSRLLLAWHFRAILLAYAAGILPPYFESRIPMTKNKPVSTYARMWPREVFDCRNGNRLLVKELEVLSQPGVYVLYRDDVPYYVGKAAKLRKRLWSHANQATTRYYNF